MERINPEKTPLNSTDPTLEKYNQSDPSTPMASPFLSISLLMTAELWAFLHPGATQGQRIALVLEVARKLGVETGHIAA